MPIAPVPTDRLELQPFTAAAIAALLAADEPRLRALTGATFPVPLAPPPLMEAVLPTMRERQEADPAQEGWWGWLVVTRDDRRVAGSLVFGGPPDPDGSVVVGYATYPAFGGRGFATEATRALADWALAHPEVRRVCATIPRGNAVARRVAEKVGMRPIGRWWDPASWDEDVEDVLLHALEREA
jgi:RimJ/RimL family protein N-acetyltransferase